MIHHRDLSDRTPHSRHGENTKVTPRSSSHLASSTATPNTFKGVSPVPEPVVVLVALALIGLASACSTSQTSRIGNAPPRAKDCAVEFVRINLTDADKMNRYQVVGTIGIGSVFSSSPDWTDALKAEVGPKVCELGGDTASLAMTTSASMGGGGTSIFALLRKPEAKQFGSAAFLKRYEPDLKQKAAFDLECSESSLVVVELGGTSRGVKGCEKQATYVFVRSGMESGNWKRE